MKDSLFEPKKILDHRNKSLFFVFMYIIVLALLMSLGTFVMYLGYRDNTVLTSASTGCEIVDSQLSCISSSHDPGTEYNIYGVTLYLLDASESIDSVGPQASQYMVLQGTTLSVYSDSSLYYSGSIAPIFQSYTDFDGFVQGFERILLVGFILIGVLLNLLIMLFFTLVSTFPFMMFRKMIPFKKRYTLAVFASTPIAFVMTFYGLIPMPEWVFLILLLVAYRSMFVLRRELTYQVFLHQAPPPQAQSSDDESVVDGEYSVSDADEDEEESDDEEIDKED